MKFIKLAIISIVVLFVIITCIGLLLPSTVRVTRNITIHTSPDTLYRYISDMAYWKFWLAGVQDNTVQFTSAKKSGAGAVAMIGEQQVSITKATNNMIETVWKNNSGKRISVFQLASDTIANETNLNWYFEQKVKWYPWERLSTLANDKILGPFMENSLDKLKEVAENTNN